MSYRRQLVVLSCALASLACAWAQQNPPAESKAPPKFYRLDFVVQEVEGGKVVNGRSYFVIAGSDSGAAVRTGNKVAFSNPQMPQQYNWFDVGVNIDCSGIREEGGRLLLHVTADISSLAPASEGAPNAPPPVRQNRWNSTVVVPIRKPAVIFSSDDLTTKRKMQLELTATPLG